MNINKKKSFSYKKNLLILSLLSILLCGAAIAYIKYISAGSENYSSLNNDTAPGPKIDTVATSSEIEGGKTIKEQALKEKPKSSKTTVNVNIEGRVIDSTLQVTSRLDKIITKGTCDIILTSGTKSIQKEPVGIQPLPSYSTCRGWKIPATELPDGLWQIKVTVTVDGVKSTAETEVKI